MFVPPPLPTLVGFLLVIFSVQGLLLFAIRRSAPDPQTGNKRVLVVGLGFGLVMLVSAFLAESGIMAAQSMPPPMMIYMVVCNGGVVLLALTKPGLSLAKGMVPGFWLVLQGFRLPLEVVLHLWHEAGTIPVQMTWSGQNFDVFAGISALILGTILLRNPAAKWAGWLGHSLGLALLFNVGRVALLSVPSPFRSMEPLLLPFHTPYIWIVPSAVSAALFAHIVGIRALLRPA
jgi:hypothetical protein